MNTKELIKALQNLQQVIAVQNSTHGSTEVSNDEMDVQYVIQIVQKYERFINEFEGAKRFHRVK